MSNLTYPGVYIEEFAPGAPIQGVGTNVAAFIGPLADGPPNEATKITSWDAFKRRFAELPFSQADHLWYAARGFFQNGGTVCYVVRLSTAAAASTELVDLNDRPTITVRSRRIGQLANALTATADQDVQAVTGRALTSPTAAGSDATGDTITTASSNDAEAFVPGDRLTWNGLAANDDPVVRRIEGQTIRLISALGQVYNNVSVGLADLVADESTDFRVDDDTDLHAGTVITISDGASPDSNAVVLTVVPIPLPSGGTTYRVVLRTAVRQDYDVSAAQIESTEFSLRIDEAGGGTWTYTNLSMEPEHPRFFQRVVADDNAGVVFADPIYPPSVSPPPENRPKDQNAVPLQGDADDDPSALTSQDFANAIDGLAAIDDVNMVAAPGRTDRAVQLALIAHCRLLWDRFAILDAPAGAPLFGTGSVETHRNGLASPEGFAALYYPWLEVPADRGTVTVPPSGHVAGIYARIDDTRGVHKAPAGEEAVVQLALGVEPTGLMSDIDQGLLNLQGINVIRVFRPGGQPVVWGARTIASDTNWQYVNIRRLFLYLEESIQEGIDWAVFEPNNLQLWKKLRRTITAFLTRVWRDGGLFGATAEEAFYVRIDEALNPFSEQQLGRLHIEVGCRPSYPAEFIVVRIGIWEGGSEIAEP